MEVCFSDLKEKEIVNVYDGKKLGRIVDVLFDTASGQVKGIVVPGDKKLFRKNEDIFVPLERLKKIGDDVILVSLQVGEPRFFEPKQQQNSRQFHEYGKGALPVSAANEKFYGTKNSGGSNGYSSYVRFRPLDEKKYR